MSAPGPTASSTRRVRGPSGFALLGVVAGIAAKAADESSWAWAADLGTYPAAWVLAAALIGRQAPTPGAAAVRSAVFFAAMSVAYYAWAALVLGFGWTWLLGAWLVLSATAVPAAGVAAHWATRRPGVPAGALMAAAAGIVIAGHGSRVVQLVADAVVALVLTVVLPRHASTRMWGVVLTLPLAWLAARGLDALYGVLG